MQTTHKACVQNNFINSKMYTIIKSLLYTWNQYININYTSILKSFLDFWKLNNFKNMFTLCR